MGQDSEDHKPPLGVDEVSRSALGLAAERELSALLARFQETIRTWAAPSAVLAAVRQPEADGDWRVLAPVTMGSLPMGFERTLTRLVEESPECLLRPTVLRPNEELAGVKVRDNWVVPWRCDGETGVLFLRGVPRPYPANLGDALALLSAPVWPRVLGGPAARMEGILQQLEQLSGQLQAEAARQLERLQAARPAEAPAPVSDAVEPERFAQLELELETACQEAGRLRGAQVELTERAARLTAEIESLRAEAEASKGRLDEQQRAAEAAEARVQAAEERAQAAEARLRSLEQSREEERAAANERFEERQRAADAAEARARLTEQALAAAQEAVAAHAESLRSERAASDDHVEEYRRAAEASEALTRTAEEALAAAHRELAQHRTRADQVEGRLLDLAGGWDATLETVRGALATLRRTAFVPPGLRFSMDEVAARVQAEAGRPSPWLRIVILDRELGGLEPVAVALEAGGVDVKIANYPEELGLLLRPPGGRELGAAVCDVMAFRPDQNVAALFRSWDQDRPGLAFFLTYDVESPVEIERARRIPPSFFVGQLPRPLDSARLAEALEPLARRHAKP